MRRATRKRSKVLFRYTSRTSNQQVSATSRKVNSVGKHLLGEDAMTPNEPLTDDHNLPSHSPSPTSRPQPNPAVPVLYTSLPTIKDILPTETSVAQDETVQECLPYLAGTADPSKTQSDFTPCGLPRLKRENHVDFLKEHLEDARYIAFDAARPWMLYWCLTGLCLLGEDVEPLRERWFSLYYLARAFLM